MDLLGNKFKFILKNNLLNIAYSNEFGLLLIAIKNSISFILTNNLFNI